MLFTVLAMQVLIMAVLSLLRLAHDGSLVLQKQVPRVTLICYVYTDALH